jgi:hypothetical protein
MQRMQRMARGRAATAVMVVAAGAIGCSSPRVRGSSRDLPAPPTLGAPIDRVGRPLTANALIGPLTSDGVSDERKEQYDRAGRAAWGQFAADIQQTLGLYDGFDHRCGNQWLSDRTATPGLRYRRLAELLADDRLWIDSRAPTCTRLMAVEQAALAAPGASQAPANDCGGRTPSHDAVDVYRSLLVLGETAGVDDGIARDDHEHSTTEFPFLAAP